MSKKSRKEKTENVVVFHNSLWIWGKDQFQTSSDIPSNIMEATKEKTVALKKLLSYAGKIPTMKEENQTRAIQSLKDRCKKSLEKIRNVKKVKEILELEKRGNVRAESIQQLGFSSFKNGIEQGRIYHEHALDCATIWGEDAIDKCLKTFGVITGEGLQVIQRKRARYLFVSEIQSEVSQEALMRLSGKILDVLQKLSPDTFKGFIGVLSTRFSAMQGKDEGKIRAMLDNLSHDLLGLKKEKKTKHKPKTDENPPQDPQDDHSDTDKENPTDTSAGRESGPKPVTFRFPAIEDLDNMGNTEASNELFNQSLRAFQGLVVSVRIDPLMYLDPNITGTLTGLMKDIQALQDKIRLDRIPLSQAM